MGIRRCDFVAQATVGLAVDLGAADAERLPPPEALQTDIFGIKVPRLPIQSSFDPLPLVIAALSTGPSGNCPKGIGNHIRPTIATQ